jgi:hypothetical protein
VTPLAVVEVDTAAVFAADLFRAAFGQPIPDFPRHFVAVFRDAAGVLSVAAYIHYTASGDDAWLCGGLCVDRAAYARARPDDAAAWKRAGGIGEIVLRATFARLTDRAAIFGYCGDARQWQHDLNAGFAPAGPPQLLVRWNRVLPEAVQARLVARAAALAPF